MKLILPLINYGPDGGGIAQYHKWASSDHYSNRSSTIDTTYANGWHAEDEDCPRFYTDEVARDIYRFMLNKVMTRVNVPSDSCT